MIYSNFENWFYNWERVLIKLVYGTLGQYLTYMTINKIKSLISLIFSVLKGGYGHCSVLLEIVCVRKHLIDAENLFEAFIVTKA